MKTKSLLSRARISMSRRALKVLLDSPALVKRFGNKRSGEVDGRTLDREFAAVLAVDDLDHGSDLRRHSPADARAKLAEQVTIMQAVSPSGVAVEDRTIPGPGGELRTRIYAPAGLADLREAVPRDPRGLEEIAPAVVFFHGGGFVTGDLDTHDPFCRRIAFSARAKVIAIDYRLAPEDRFPAAVDDCIAGTRWVLSHAKELGIDPARVAVMGDSAGGNLAAVVARRMRDEALRPALQVLIYPATDATCALPSHAIMGGRYLLTSEMIDWYYAHYLGPDPELRRHPDMSPLLALDVDRCPPALVYVSGFDPLRDEGSAYADHLVKAGIAAKTHELRTMTHGFALMTALTEANVVVIALTEEVGRSLRAV